MSKIVIAGASGFLGSHLCRQLKFVGQEIVALERHRDFLENTDRVAKWDGKTVDLWIEELEAADMLINLSGNNVAVKWTEENRKTLRDSRIGTTQLLAEACGLTSAPPTLWVNMSGINYYRQNLQEPLDELGPPGSGFLFDLVREWEAALFDPDLANMKRIALRTAPVLGEGGGAFGVFEKLVRWFVGGKAGSGNQWMSWIRVEDWVRLVEWVIRESEGIEGNQREVYNACAPEPVRNKEFMAEMRRAYRRPWAPPAPEFAIKLFGAMGGPDPSLALDGFRVVPQRALDEGFEFRFPTLKEALANLLGPR